MLPLLSHDFPIEILAMLDSGLFGEVRHAKSGSVEAKVVEMMRRC